MKKLLFILLFPSVAFAQTDFCMRCPLTVEQDCIDALARSYNYQSTIVSPTTGHTTANPTTKTQHITNEMEKVFRRRVIDGDVNQGVSQDRTVRNATAETKYSSTGAVGR